MLGEAFITAKDFPFRAQSVKSIIVINSKQCDEAEIQPVSL